MKTCTKCGLTKPLDAFWRRNPKYSKDGREAQCADCKREYHRAKFHALSDRKRLYRRAKNRYNLSPKRVDELMDRSGGRCEACGKPLEGRDLVFDHDHGCCPDGQRQTCGRCVRGLLCMKCNVALGHLENGTIDLLRDYLARYCPFGAALEEGDSAA